jgi:nucleoside 2-deoxyribosyltransferase
MFRRSEETDKILSVSYWVRHNQHKENYVQIDILKLRPLLIPFVSPKPKEQANKLLFWIGDNFPKPNDEIDFELNDLISVIAAYDANGVDYICRFLINEGIFDKANISPYSESGSFSGILSFKGWDRYYELQRSNKDSRLAFMAMKFGEEPLNSIYKKVIKKAVEQTGFDLRKLDEEPRAGLIDDKLRVEIRRSKFLIADLTHDNNGAYWEAGFAEGLGMPVIYICEEEKFKSSKSHFDTNHHLTVTWKNDEAGLKKFAEELKATIRATFPAEAKMED